MTELPNSTIAVIIVIFCVFVGIYLVIMITGLAFWIKTKHCCQREPSNNTHTRRPSLTVDTQVRTAPPPSYSSAEFYPPQQPGMIATRLQVENLKCESGRTPPPSYKSECSLDSYARVRGQVNGLQTLDENVMESDEGSQYEQGSVSSGIAMH